MLIGYARVSTVQQNLDRQLGALRAAGCIKIFTEKASGKAVHGRPALERAIDALGTDDVLVLSEWDRCTRSMMDGISIMQRVHARGAAIKVLDKAQLDLTTKIGQGFLAFLSALAEDERERIVKRANEGRLAAKKAGQVRPAAKTQRHAANQGSGVASAGHQVAGCSGRDERAPQHHFKAALTKLITTLFFARCPLFGMLGQSPVFSCN
jgi:DNA invertase Pin-like site-specific DNA recombinase